MLTVQVSQEVLVMSQHRDEDQSVSCFSIERNHPSVISGEAAFASATSYSSSSKGKNMGFKTFAIFSMCSRRKIYIFGKGCSYLFGVVK